VTNYPDEEMWRYSAPYDDVVSFLQTRFASGRRYDTHGATWWNGLPPCYDTNHQSPPWGWTISDGTEWVWSDGARRLGVLLEKPGIKNGVGEIVPWGTVFIVTSTITSETTGVPCYRG
jgi:hypothetical protein